MRREIIYRQALSSPVFDIFRDDVEKLKQTNLQFKWRRIREDRPKVRAGHLGFSDLKVFSKKYARVQLCLGELTGEKRKIREGEREEEKNYRGKRKRENERGGKRGEWKLRKLVKKKGKFSDLNLWQRYDKIMVAWTWHVHSVSVFVILFKDFSLCLIFPNNHCLRASGEVTLFRYSNICWYPAMFSPWNIWKCLI